MVSIFFGMNALLHQMKYGIFSRVGAQGNANSELVSAQTNGCRTNECKNITEDFLTRDLGALEEEEDD